MDFNTSDEISSEGNAFGGKVMVADTQTPDGIVDETGQLPASIPVHIAAIIQKFAQDAKTLLRENLMAEYLFGSYAKNTYTSLSDIDMLFLVKTFSPEIRRQLSGLASEYSLEYDVYISPIIKDQQVWGKNKQYSTLFFQEVTQHGIPL